MAHSLLSSHNMQLRTSRSDEESSRSALAASDDGGAVRLGISLPAALGLQLDAVVAERGYANRSQAIAEMLSAQLVELAGKEGHEVVAGTITYVYDHRGRNTQTALIDIQHQFLIEVITVQTVHLERGLSMQVLLVQGPARRLRLLADRLLAVKGVKHGRLQTFATLLPPLHQKSSRKKVKQKS